MVEYLSITVLYSTGNLKNDAHSMILSDILITAFLGYQNTFFYTDIFYILFISHTEKNELSIHT